MPREPHRRDMAEEWLRHARSNLSLARHGRTPDVLLNHLCFESHQAAEKAVKGVLVFRDISFPYTHDLGVLLDLLEGSGESVPDAVWVAAPILSPYAIHARYPAFANPPGEDDYRRALEGADAVVRWAEGIVHGG
ncbi:MAG TPA: HEPN domain-containing protein [Candidatus Methylomirabilis sp.]|nr:HEPN domain-containing protein [Candidatus Methylomirabilis sp.]